MAEPSAKRRKLSGGQRQRVAKLLSNEHSSSAEPLPQVKSLLAKDLVYKWSWGKLSPQEVQHSADLACKDILAMGGQEPLDLLSNLGSGGKFKQKMHQELVAIVSKHLAISKLHDCYIPFDGFEKPVLQSMLLPHILFADLFHNYQQAFQASLLPRPDDIKAFWKLQENHPAWNKHDISKRSSSKCIPLLLHGDGTPVISIGKLWSKQLTSFTLWYWFGVCIPGAPADQHILLEGLDHFACWFRFLLNVPPGGDRPPPQWVTQAAQGYVWLPGMDHGIHRSQVKSHPQGWIGKLYVLFFAFGIAGQPPLAIPAGKGQQPQCFQSLAL